MKVSIVIPNYNGEDLLKKNLPKVFKALDFYSKKENVKGEIIVVDDCSKDSSVKELKKQNVRVMENEKNLGFSSTVNKGVKNAKGEVVVLLNTDVYPTVDFLISLLSHFNDPKVFAAGCLDKSVEGEKTVERGRGIGKWSKGFLIHSKGDVNHENTLWVGGGSGAFKKELWDRLGGLDILYNPFYWEDIDISYRALKSGFKVLFDKRSVVYHEHSIGSIKKNYSDFKIKTIAYRNQFIFSWKNATDFNLYISNFLFLPYHFVKALKRLDLAFLIGFLKAFILLPKIIQSSITARKSYVLKDREVIGKINL